MVLSIDVLAEIGQRGGLDVAAAAVANIPLAAVAAAAEAVEDVAVVKAAEGIAVVEAVEEIAVVGAVEDVAAEVGIDMFEVGRMAAAGKASGGIAQAMAPTEHT